MYEGMKDAELFELFREGKEEPFEILYERYKPRLYVFLRNFLPQLSPDEITDLIQEIFLKVIEKANKYKKKHAFSTWIYTIARNKAIDRWRRLQRKGELGLQESPDPEKIAMERSKRKELLENLQKLPIEYREVLLLRAEGFSYKEISRILFIPERVAITRMHRGIKKLKEHMSDE